MGSGYEIGHKQIEQWLGGVSYEVAFWNGYLRRKENREATLKKVSSKHDIEQPLRIKDEKMLTKEFRVLDVGCGMAYHNAPYIMGREVDLHYVDPLALFYNRILKEQKLDLPQIEFGMVEYLSGFYPENSVDLILIQNALDHCFQPVRGIMESLRVLKEGGTLYLFHHKNEAEHENYIGFHQFNIDRKDGRLMIWNREQSFCINDLLQGYANVETEEINDHIRVWITKEKDLPPNSQKEDVRILSEQIMYCMEKLLDSKFTRKYQRAFRREKALHFLSGIISSEFKEKYKARKKNGKKQG